MTGIDIAKILSLAPPPSYVVDLGRLQYNLSILDEVQKRNYTNELGVNVAFNKYLDGSM